MNWCPIYHPGVHRGHAEGSTGVCQVCLAISGYPKLASYLYRVKCPTLIVWGERDGMVPVIHGQMYQAEIGEAVFTILPSTATSPFEHPEALANAVLEILGTR